MNWVFVGMGGVISIALAIGLMQSNDELNELREALAEANERIDSLEDEPPPRPLAPPREVAEVERSLAELAEISTEKFRIIEAMSTRLSRAERRLAQSQQRGSVRTTPLVIPPRDQGEVKEALQALREDVDSILNGEVAAAQLVAAALTSNPEPAAVEPAEEAPAEAAPTEPAAEERKVTAEEVATALGTGLRQSWLDDFATSARLSGKQKTELTDLMGGLRSLESTVVRSVLDGGMSPHDAKVKLRQAVVDANAEMRGLLNSRQRQALRSELRRRNDLAWSLFAAGQ